ncbi:LysR family transcriptional regulator [Chungangia koreensis]|uniref:LysR family transcriptional regulator n=1 Tax=Chungangia koreensis TaxID=752657 RepID=A0ABV8X1W1_9LACT
MDLKDCSLLLSLYEEKNLRKVAEKLYISQPAITYRLKQIEDKFQARLVERTNKGVVFTLEGEHVVKFAQTMLNEFSAAKDYVYNMSSEVRGVLRLSVTSNFAQYILPNLLKRFSEQYPNVQIHLKTGKSKNVLQQLKDDDAHLAILRGDYAWLEEKKKIHQERILLISKIPLKMENLPDYPRIFYVTDQLLSQIIDNWWTENYSSPPNNVVEADKVEACRDLARTGMGYTIIPEICLSKSHFDEMFVYPLKSPQEDLTIRNTWLLHKRKSRELSVVDAFIDFIENELKSGEIIRVFNPEEHVELLI